MFEASGWDSHTLRAGKEVVVFKVRAMVSGVIAGLAIFLVRPADAQNLDAGKSPAQIFADTCSACHRRAQDLRKPSAAFLRGHYTTGQQEAATMANYLASIPADPRAQQKRQPGAGPTPAETVPSRRQDQSKGQPKEQAKAPPAAPSTSRRGGRGEAKAPASAAATAPETNPPEPPVQPIPAVPPAPPPLEPFEE